MMQPHFLRQRLNQYAHAAIPIIDQFTANWRDGEKRDLHKDLMGLTLQIIGDVVLGIDVVDDGELIENVLDVIMDDFKFRLETGLNMPMWVPTPGHWRFRRALKALDEMIYRKIAERRKDPGNYNDLLAQLIKGSDDDQEHMSDVQLRDEVVTMLLAGHETTANTLAWAFYLLGKNSKVESRLCRELEALAKNQCPTIEDLNNVPVLEHVLLETMRLFPTAYLMGREATCEVELGGYKLPAGISIMMSQWVLHRDQRFYDEPEEFKPERWEDGSRNLPERAYFPFGAGPRLCIGKDFGMMEASLILAAFLTRFQFTLPDDSTVLPWPSITLRPKNGLMVKIKRRENANSELRLSAVSA